MITGADFEPNALCASISATGPTVTVCGATGVGVLVELAFAEDLAGFVAAVDLTAAAAGVDWASARPARVEPAATSIQSSAPAVRRRRFTRSSKFNDSRKLYWRVGGKHGQTNTGFQRRQQP
jgi:hypothetical protein